MLIMQPSRFKFGKINSLAAKSTKLLYHITKYLLYIYIYNYELFFIKMKCVYCEIESKFIAYLDQVLLEIAIQLRYYKPVKRRYVTQTLSRNILIRRSL